MQHSRSSEVSFLSLPNFSVKALTLGLLEVLEFLEFLELDLDLELELEFDLELLELELELELWLSRAYSTFDHVPWMSLWCILHECDGPPNVGPQS